MLYSPNALMNSDHACVLLPLLNLSIVHQTVYAFPKDSHQNS